MTNADIKRVLELIKKSGFYDQDNRKVRSGFEITKLGEAKLVEELKTVEVGKDSDFSNEELFELYRMIASLHDFDNNREKEILYQLRSIKFKPSDEEVRFKYLNKFWNYIIDHRSDLGETEREILKNEYNKFRKYIYMEWGKDGELYNKCLMILEELEAPHPNESSDEIKDFIEEWKRVNRMYRPDKQALDYASQVIYEQVTN